VIKRWIQFSSVEFVRSPPLSAILKSFIVDLNQGDDLDSNFSKLLYTTINEIAKDILTPKPVRKFTDLNPFFILELNSLFYANICSYVMYACT
jgi:hypothetical protein